MFLPKLLWIICCFYIITSYADYHLKFTNVECTTNPKFFYNHSCRLKAVNRYRTVGFMKTFIKDSLRNVSLNIAVYRRNEASYFKPFLLNITQNLCKILNTKASGVYMNIFVNLMAKYSNINHSCPYHGSVFVENVYFDETYSKFISTLSQWFQPLASYKIKVTFYEGYPLETLGYASYQLQVIESRPRWKYQIEDNSRGGL